MKIAENADRKEGGFPKWTLQGGCGVPKIDSWFGGGGDPRNQFPIQGEAKDNTLPTRAMNGEASERALNPQNGHHFSCLRPCGQESLGPCPHRLAVALGQGTGPSVGHEA